VGRAVEKVPQSTLDEIAQLRTKAEDAEQASADAIAAAEVVRNQKKQTKKKKHEISH
jgi:hypothetical protein